MLSPSSYVIITNANTCLLAHHIITDLAKTSIVVALDGAALQLAKLGIKPHMIIGDGDSLMADPKVGAIWGVNHAPLATTPYYGRFATLIVPHYNQNLTDLHKAILFIKQHARKYHPYQPAQVIHVITTLGQRTDHYLAGIHIMAQEYEPNLPIYYHNLGQTIEYVKDRTVRISGKIGDHCGIFGFPSGTLSVLNHGLAYNVMAYPLHPGQYSSANYLCKAEAILAITGSALIVHPPQYPAQRHYQDEQVASLFTATATKLSNRVAILSATACAQALHNWPNAGIMLVSHPLHTLAALVRDAAATPVLVSIPATHYAAVMAANDSA